MSLYEQTWALVTTLSSPWQCCAGSALQCTSMQGTWSPHNACRARLHSRPSRHKPAGAGEDAGAGAGAGAGAAEG